MTLVNFNPNTVIKSADVNANFASLAAGTDITALSYSTTTRSLPYKFSVYKTTAQTGATTTKITWDTELFDTNNNFVSSTYTAPVSGFYWLKASAYISSSTTIAYLSFYKNGTLFTPGDAQSSTSSGDVIVSINEILQLTAADTIDVRVAFGGGGSRTVYGLTDVAIGTTGPTKFEGFLLSNT